MRPNKDARVEVIKSLSKNSVPIGTAGTVVALLGEPLMSFTVEWDDKNYGMSAFDTVTASLKLQIITEEVKNDN